MQTNQTPHPLEAAAQVFGSEAALARAIGVARGALNQWKKPGREVPAKYAPAIEVLTGVRCELLCPSVNWSVVRTASRRRFVQAATRNTSEACANA